jgi:hypothetical protein
MCTTTDVNAQALARQGLFGRGLPAEQQTFVVVTDSVAKQLDGLKKDPALSAAVRRFWSHGLDACGPAGAPLHSGVPAQSCPCPAGRFQMQSRSQALI